MNSFYFWDEMAAKCLKSEHFHEAIQSYKHALESADNSAEQASVWANIGNIYLTIQNIPSAVDAFLTASRLDPASYDINCILERITANGYLDESATIMSKEMAALDSIKTGPEIMVRTIQPVDEPEAETSGLVATEGLAEVSPEPEAPVEVSTPELVVEETNPEAAGGVEAPEMVAVAEVLPGSQEVAEEVTLPIPEMAKAFVEIPVTEIFENPLRLRLSMQSESLVESVRRYGILQPLIVARIEAGKYMVVAGNRRLEAARQVGLEQVPAVVRSANESEFLELALIENIQRVNLDSLELAETYRLLIEKFGMPAELVAASIGKSPAMVAATVNLLKLTEEGKQALREKSISEGHAGALVEIDLPALQNNALVYVLENRLGVRQTEDLVRIILNAVAVSRSYDEACREEAFTEPQALEGAPTESALETAPETQEPEPVADAQPQPETALAEELFAVAAAEAAVESPAVVAEAQLEPAPEANPEAEQSIELDLSDDAVMDLLVAESAQAELWSEQKASEKQAASEAATEEDALDFYWIKSETEAEGQSQPASVDMPTPVELGLEETTQTTAVPLAIPAETIFAAANRETTSERAVQAEVALADPAFSVAIEVELQKAAENLDQAIEEIVQFTKIASEPEPQPEPDPEPATELPSAVTIETGASGQKEPETVESRPQLKGLEAIAVYKRVVENNPANVRIWHLLGNLYSDLGQYEEAIDCLKRATELDPGKFTYYYHLGLNLAISKRYPEAILALEKTIELAPQHVLAHCSLAGCYRRIGNLTTAQKYIEMARPALTQEKAYNRACFESIAGNNDEALELLHIALDTDKTPLEWLLRDPDLDFIRDDPRFQALIAEQTALG